MKVRNFEFARCQRADGSYYGTAGQCRKGREVDPRREIDKIARGLSRTKGDVFRSAIDPDKGLIGEGKSLGNGVTVVRGNARELERLGKLPGLPRPTAKVIEGPPNTVIVASKNVRPWTNLEIPSKFMTGYRLGNPMSYWLDSFSRPDTDMAVNPVLLSANSLLKSAYDRYNKEFFGGKLPEVGLYVAPSMTRAYGIAMDKSMVGRGKSFIALSMKHFKDATEEAIHGTLLHEMVHIQMFSEGRWKESHGKVFTTKLNDISKAWKRDSMDVYADKIISAPGVLTGQQRLKASFTPQFRHAARNENIKEIAVNDQKYRFAQWK